jgi:hypothetical protein
MYVEEMIARYGTFKRMFEFHHIEPLDKHPYYTKLMKRVISAEQIEEVDKCVLLCSECQGIVHAQDQKGTLTIYADIDDRKVLQKFNGWFVLDYIEKSITFLSNEKNLLQPCIVKVGTEKEKKYFILELMQDKCLYKWLNEIGRHKRIEVRSINRKQIILEVEHVNGKRANIRIILGMPIFAMNFDVSEGTSSYLWLRNGMVLTKEGKVISEGEVSFPVDLNIES